MDRTAHKVPVALLGEEMTKAEVKDVHHGLYRLFWKEGGSSLAAVGSDRAGRRWYAPENWIEVPSFDWRPVKSVKRLYPKTYSMADLAEGYDEDGSPN